MKSLKIFLALGCALCLLAGTAGAADSVVVNKAIVKPTCCQQAAAKGKECRKKCCVAAHHEGKSCERCNPNKEDLKLKKDLKKSSLKATEK